MFKMLQKPNQKNSLGKPKQNQASSANQMKRYDEKVSSQLYDDVRTHYPPTKLSEICEPMPFIPVIQCCSYDIKVAVKRRYLTSQWDCFSKEQKKVLYNNMEKELQIQLANRKPASNRLENMGPTPNKKSKTGQAVIARNLTRGTLPGGHEVKREGENTVFIHNAIDAQNKPTTQSFDLGSPKEAGKIDMGHIFSAVEFFNDFGAYVPNRNFTNDFMKDSHNYRLELGSDNSKKGPHVKYVKRTPIAALEGMQYIPRDVSDTEDESNFYDIQKEINRRLPWQQGNDKLLTQAIERLGTRNWNEVARAVPNQTSRQCRERWQNFLDPSTNHVPFSEEEDNIIIEKKAKLGIKWDIIATYLQNRTENSVKNRWFSSLIKKTTIEE